MTSKPNNRYIFSGGPGAGKTTVLEALKARGHECVPEVARALIRERLDAGLVPRPPLSQFARNTLRRDVRNYRTVTANDAPVFFDRGCVDALGMAAAECDVSEAKIRTWLTRYPYNLSVFLFPPWEEIYANDSERDQTFEEAIAVYGHICAWYQRCGYRAVEVPTGSVDERVRFIETAVLS